MHVGHQWDHPPGRTPLQEGGEKFERYVASALERQDDGGQEEEEGRSGEG